MERAKLNRLNKWEEPPSEKTWSSICESLDRDQISNRLADVEVPLPSHAWLRILQAKDDRKVSRNRYALVAIFFFFLFGAMYWVVSPSTHRPLAISKGTTPSPVVILNDPPKDLSPRTVTDPIQKHSDRIDQTNLFSQASTKKSAARVAAPIQSDYLLIASKTGKPLRVHLKWEYLSCCLSGEMQNADCDQQQNKWHAEVLQTELGFQADPFMGLLALIDAEN